MGNPVLAVEFDEVSLASQLRLRSVVRSSRSMSAVSKANIHGRFLSFSEARGIPMDFACPGQPILPPRFHLCSLLPRRWVLAFWPASVCAVDALGVIRGRRS